MYITTEFWAHSASCYICFRGSSLRHRNSVLLQLTVAQQTNNVMVVFLGACWFSYGLIHPLRPNELGQHWFWYWPKLFPTNAVKISNRFHCVDLDNKLHGANMGTTWVLSAPDGPHVDTSNLAIWWYVGVLKQKQYKSYFHRPEWNFRWEYGNVCLLSCLRVIHLGSHHPYSPCYKGGGIWRSHLLGLYMCNAKCG